MRAGKKQAADSGKTRPCIVYVRNIREELPGPGRPRKATQQQQQQQQQQRVQQQLKQEQDQQLRETRGRRAGGVASATASIHERQPPGIALRTRQVATPPVKRQHQLVSSPPSPQRKAKDTILAKRRNTNLLLGNPIQKVGSLNTRRITTHTEPTPSRAQTPKMFKSKHQPVAMSPPPTIAASRSRRSIKPNPKYTSEDMVTPKYLAALASESGSSPSPVGRHRSKQMYRNSNDDLNDLLDLDEDDDDELADAAFNPQLHKSDDDDDDDLSEGEFEEELRRPKLPPVKRGRGRPPKASTLANASSSSLGNTSSVASKMGASAGRPTPSSLQQLRRNMAVNIARNNASLTEGSQISNAKRKLEINDTDSPVARKRMVLSAMGGSGQRSVPVVNGATKTSSKMGQLRMVPQSSSVTFKVNTGGGGGGRTVPGNSRSAGGGGGGGASLAGSDSKHNKSDDGDDVPTFTIVNIDDIINQDDVLISRANINAAAAAAAAASTGGTVGKKLPVGRPRTRGILPNSSSSGGGGGGAGEKKTADKEKSSPSSLSSLSPPKRIKILASNTSSSNAANKSHSGYNQNKNILMKPQPRILNTEMGKKTQTMKPLMNMGKEICPTDIDTEEDDLEPDLDLDDDEPPATIVTRKNIKSITLTSTPHPHASAASKWNTNNNNNNNNSNNRRNILSTSSASSVNARTDRKLSKLLGESGSGSGAGGGSGELPALFKKPGISPQRRSKENHQQKDDDQKDAGGSETHKSITNSSSTSTSTSTSSSSHPKYFPPETTIFCEEDGRVVKKITCYETWHVISTAKDSPAKSTRQQRTCLELALVKLANVASRIKVPSSKWTSKVTLYKVSPTLMQRQTMTIFTGDLKVYNIPEEDRHKYQPSCVLFRRSALDRTKCRVPYDRAIIFKNKCFYANIDGKHVNLLGAPESVNTLKDVEILLDIVDRLSLNSELVEMVNTTK
ncbi:hypothetical protein KR067_010024 [Drosophila pandora]|nr:hypothetical protein KR067_010024 [Drosophila pandora]